MEEQRDKQHRKVDDTRRGFLAAGIYGLLSIMGCSFGVTSALYLLRTPKQTHESGWADAGDVSALRVGIPQKVTFERTRTDGWRISNQKDSAWVLKANDGTVVAFSPLCTHLGCAYRWQSGAGHSQDGTFVCPCHGSTFSRNGDVITGPANRPLDRFQTKREGTRLWLGSILSARNSNG